MIIFGVGAYLSDGEVQLAVWCVLGLALGTQRAATRALTKGAAATCGPADEMPLRLSAYVEAATLASVVGVNVWGGISDFVSVEATLYFGGIGSAVIGTWWLFGPAVSCRPGHRGSASWRGSTLCT